MPTVIGQSEGERYDISIPVGYAAAWKRVGTEAPIWVCP